MHMTRFGDFTLSRLMLGTVQFGLQYGIANASGQPSYETARDMLACAYEGGVNCLDTAAAYGSSEEVVGRALSELQLADRFVVVTKIQHCGDAITAQADADRFVEASLTESMKKLHLDPIPICLLHAEQDFRYIDALVKLQEKGLVRHIGLSVYTTGAAREALASGKVQAMQLPASVFDHRFAREGMLTDARQRGAAMFVRSVYLQGLLFMPEERIPQELAEVVPVRRRLAEIAEQAGLSLAELAMRYVLSLEGVTCALSGVDTVEQLRENLALFGKGSLNEDTMQAIEAAVPDLPETILFPFNWPKG